MATIQPITELAYLGKTKAELRELQKGEDRWRAMIEYLEGGPIPNKCYPRTTLPEFTIYEDLLYYVTKQQDGSINFNLIIPKCLKEEKALKFAR